MRYALIIFALCCVGCLGIRYPPVNTVLSAPWTPFTGPPTYALNVNVIWKYAANIAASGVNVVWIAGGMGQFDTLTVNERRQLAEAWVPAAKANGLYLIVHVGTTVQQDAIALAEHAASIGADAIASVPPYYERTGDPETLAKWFLPIVQASGNLPFLYYHIPGATGVDISMSAFLPVVTRVIPSFAGVKWVSSDTGDYIHCTKVFGNSLRLLWAPEPKLQAIPLGAQGVILAESFYAGTWLRMCHAASNGNWRAAYQEQHWKRNIDSIMGQYGGGAAKRALFNYTAKIDIGPARPPSSDSVPITASQYTSLIAALTSAGFFNQTIPAPCMLPSVFN